MQAYIHPTRPEGRPMTGRHGDPRCGTDNCFACALETTDGRPRKWFDANQWLDDPPDTKAPRLAAVLADLDLDHDEKETS